MKTCGAVSTELSAATLEAGVVTLASDTDAELGSKFCSYVACMAEEGSRDVERLLLGLRALFTSESLGSNTARAGIVAVHIAVTSESVFNNDAVLACVKCLSVGCTKFGEAEAVCWRFVQ